MMVALCLVCILLAIKLMIVEHRFNAMCKLVSQLCLDAIDNGSKRIRRRDKEEA